MLSLNEVCDRIASIDKQIIKNSKAHWDSIAKPIEGLGRMEELVTRIAGAQGDVNADIGKKAVVVFCADNGVVKKGVTQVDSSVTGNIVRSLVRGTASVAVMAKQAGADCFVADVGVLTDEEGAINLKLMHGTNDISEGPAMTREIAIKTMENAANLIFDLKDKGYKIVATGEAGIGNTTTTAAVASALLGLDPEITTGKGSGLTDAALLNKIEVIKKSLSVNGHANVSRNNKEAGKQRDFAIDVLYKVGGLDIAAMAGAYLGAAACGMPIVMDGVISSVAALVAYMINPLVKDYIIPSHMSSEPAMVKICEILGIEPVVYAGMHLGEGTGAVLMLAMLDNVISVYHDGASFETIDVDQYEHL